MPKSLSICIVGKPNAGKSTLLNHIVGEKISIVTPKVQTTRSIITGILTIEDTQLIMFDTPGIFQPKKKLEKAMVRCAWSSLASADLIVLIIDSTRKIDEKMQDIISRIKESNKPIIFLLNKSDIKSKYFIENITYLEEAAKKARIFRISALKGKNVDNFVEYLIEKAQDSSWLYEQDDITNLPSRFLACEITREQLFLKLQQELPYNLTVENENWTEQKDGSIKINQIIIVSRDSNKNIIIGKNGSMIKEVGSKARENIETLIGTKIHLFLFVKVRKNWEDNPEHYHNMGLNY